jgi:hypothetical protein
MLHVDVEAMHVNVAGLKVPPLQVNLATSGTHPSSQCVVHSSSSENEILSSPQGLALALMMPTGAKHRA